MSLDKTRLGLGTLDKGRVLLRGRYVEPSIHGMLTYGSIVFGVSGRVWLGPLDVPWRVEVDRIIYQVGAASVGNVRLVIYREGPTIDRADGGAVVVESGSVAQAAAYSLQVVTIPNTILEAGEYYIGIQGDNITGTFLVSYEAAATIGRIFDQVYGAFTDPCPATLAMDRIPFTFLRVVRDLV